jgi:hypothetical protein
LLHEVRLDGFACLQQAPLGQHVLCLRLAFGGRALTLYASGDIRAFGAAKSTFRAKRHRGREKKRDCLAEKIGFELMATFRRTIAPYLPTKCVFRLSAANRESKSRIGRTGQCRISVRNQCILRPFPVLACLQSCVGGTQPRVRIQSSPPASLRLFFSLGGVLPENHPSYNYERKDIGDCRG